MCAAFYSLRRYALCFVCLFAAGCGGSQSSDNIVQIGTTKAALFGPPLEYRALQPRLEDLFQSRVVFTPQPDGEAIGAQLDLGNVAFAILSAKEYCQVADPSKLTLLATAINSAGKSSHKAFIVARSGSSVEKIADLKGKRFAYGSRNTLLTDLGVRAALTKAGLPPKELATELLPPPIAYEGRLYAGSEAPNKVAVPILRGDVIPISGGVIDELAWDALSATGGNIVTGPSKDDFRILGETLPVPEMLVVAGPAAKPAEVSAMKDYLLNQAGSDENICKQMGIKGFTTPDKASYDLVRLLLKQEG
ncbi:MAG TPA: PhnD/SsuA/transferrin family substrate-binding protein [Phycisphaerae bacterium]|nr:PhnD/SsuA/transferrin family substrate-binding protein [Phycisphaerae bacterium]HRW54116.1 PhnD/SsuA/transferrin family substrate-binding protein [Phycisphaerae bacterium]